MKSHQICPECGRPNRDLYAEGWDAAIRWVTHFAEPAQLAEPIRQIVDRLTAERFGR